MKAVVYHADADFAWGGSVGDIYKEIFPHFVKACNSFGLEVIHLTVDGHGGWGDSNYFYDLDPKNVVFNREEVFTDFLANKAEDGEQYLFTEPDTRIIKPIPSLASDLALLYRADGVQITPAWKLATTKALPMFELFRDEMRNQERKDWHGDSVAYTNVWQKMGEPKTGKRFNYLGVDVEMRDYRSYIKNKNSSVPVYSINYIGDKKNTCLAEFENGSRKTAYLHQFK